MSCMNFFEQFWGLALEIHALFILSALLKSAGFLSKWFSGFGLGMEVVVTFVFGWEEGGTSALGSALGFLSSSCVAPLLYSWAGEE